MRLRDILSLADARGIVLSTREGRLFAKSSNGQPLDGEFRAILSDNKGALLEWLEHDALNDSSLSELVDAALPSRTARGFASSTQARLWYLEQVLDERCPYNEQLEIGLHGPLDSDALQQTLDLLVMRHQALRSRFVQDAQGRVALEVTQAATAAIAYDDLTLHAGADIEQAAEAIALQEGRRRFDLARDALIRFRLLRLAPREHRLLLTLHHIVMDGASMAVFYDELSMVYSGLVRGAPAQLPPLPLEYADYSRCVERWQTGENCRASLDFWASKLAGLSGRKTVPPDHERNEAAGFRGHVEHFEVDPALSRRLSQLAGSEGATLYMALLAAFKILLARYTDETDLAVATPVANRPHPDLGRLFGLFANTLVIRSELDAALTYRQVLGIVSNVVLEAFEHQHVPFDQIIERIKPDRVGMAMPLTQVMFVMQPATRRLSLADLDAEVHGPKHLGYAKFDLTLSVTRGPNGALTGHCEYDADLYEASSITRLISHYVALLHSIVGHPDEAIGALSLMGGQDRSALLAAQHSPRADDLPGGFVFELFEQQARQAPAHPAIICGDQHVSYGDAVATVNRIANYLVQTGVTPGARVGLHLDKSAAAVLCLFAIWKAGAIYVPVDPALPDERVRYLVDDTRMAVLLTGTPAVAALARDGTRTIVLDHAWADIEAQPPVYKHPLPSSTESLAYILYTSGTTGEPKGVMVRHRSVTHLAHAAARLYGIDSTSRVLQFTSFNFDPSIEQIVTTLRSGGTLFPVSKRDVMPGPELAALIRDQAITHANLTPSALALLPADNLRALRCVISGGERCTQDLVRRWAPGRRFLNCYGPTEATVTATAASCSPDDRQMTIGRPLEHVACYVLDVKRQPVPVGVIGELYIGGTGVAAGYWQSPELTGQRFIANPFGEPGMLYKTGDLVKQLADGRIVFVGRKDGQVKIRGQRVELGEIEAALNGANDVLDSRVVVRDLAQRGETLIAYALTHDGEPLDTAAVLTALEARLPGYMVPAAVVVLREFPLTVAGKLDTRALPLPDFRAARNSADAAVLPRSDTEKRVAAVWTEVLGQQVENIDDDFFRLGGHSLAAVRLIARLNAHFDVELPLTALLASPTVRGIAAQLASRHAPHGAWTPLVALEKGAHRTPVFCVHPAGGTVSCFKALAALFGAQGHPVFGFQPLGFEAGQTAQRSISEMASFYVDHLLAQHPRGPYVLIGYSAGGAVAYEMARRLTEAKHSVSLVGLVDTYLFENDATTETIGAADDTMWLLRWLSDGIHAPNWNGDAITDYLTGVSVDARFESAVQFARAAGAFPDDLDGASIRRMIDTYRAHCLAIAGYRPTAWPTPPLLLLRAAEHTFTSTNRRGGQPWPRQSGAASSERIVPGRHETVLSMPHVGKVVEALSECLTHRAPQGRALPLVDDARTACASNQ
ncbi:amino acid adenylation domain-containing protein [Paraburkholderia madseniana]|uniref:Amino acid adenylation domain-containing protein n=1 Tax=Paraburkholderia madseniana TaxID=2599607 RepID=A0A6N6WEK2_9BURK|nr:non-ribosomal peptide synthetase [Paraburkholderia madseniana]KAE8758419.1 amino acid adenylation domain-containing protein [Paraburkholderia madseniana]